MHSYKKRSIGMVFLSFITLTILSVFFSGQVSSAKKKVVKNTYVVLQSQSKHIGHSYKNRIINSNPKKIKIKKNKQEGIFVTAKKPGKAKLKVITKKTKYIYTIKVLSIDDIEKTATKKLNEKLSKLGISSGYVLADLNGDKVTDLYANGCCYAYNYFNKKLIKITLDVCPENIESIRISQEKRMIYLEAAPGTAARTTEAPSVLTPPTTKDDDFDPYYGTPIGVFYGFDDTTYYDDGFFLVNRDYSIQKYTFPQYFVDSKIFVEGTDYYFFNDVNYDQDDYWYEPFTKEDIEKKIDSLMPDSILFPVNASSGE